MALSNLQISRAFDRGNYCQAYETEHYYRAVAQHCKRRSNDYLHVFTIAFFGAHERTEVSESDLEAYDRAHASPIAYRVYGMGLADRPAYTRPRDSEISDAAAEYLEHGAPARAHTSMSFGVMPERADFDRAFEAYCPDGTFSFGNDPYVGTDTLDADRLWSELEAQHAAWEAGQHAEGCPGDGSCRGEGCPSDDAGRWCSDVLGILGFEWI